MRSVHQHHQIFWIATTHQPTHFLTTAEAIQIADELLDWSGQTIGIVRQL